MPTTMWGMILHVEGLRWHDPISVVGAPSRSECYGVVAPPRSWGRGIRNAAHPPFRSPSLEAGQVKDGREHVGGLGEGFVLQTRCIRDPRVQ